MLYKICNKCKENKLHDEFYTRKIKNKTTPKYICKICDKNYQFSQRENNTRAYKKHLKTCKKYRDAHKEQKAEYNKKYDFSEYQKNRRKTDKMFKLQANLRSRLGCALKAKSWKKRYRYLEYIGCTSENLIMHIEKQFKEGMSWSNYGEWEIDHIKPLARAKNPEELFLRCHYSNLQPLWKSDNRKKRDKE